MAGAFLPQGPTYMVGDVAVQCAGAVGGSSYRIRNINAREQYLTWGTSEGGIWGGAPLEGAPAENTIGMDGGRTEIFTLAADAWFISDAPRNFEVTPGEGGV